MRIVVDTNIWVSYLLLPNSPSVATIDALTANHRLLYSLSTLRELAEVLARPKFTKYIDRQDSEAFVQQFVEIGESIESTIELTVCRDPDDNKFLALAIDGQADYIITGDKDLLALKFFRDIPIIPLASCQDYGLV